MAEFIAYENFQLSDGKVNDVKKLHQIKAVMEYIKTNGEEPSNPWDMFTATDDELELHRRAWYALQTTLFEQMQPNNEIWYTTSDNNILMLNPVINCSNTYENGKGVLAFPGDLSTIGRTAFRDSSTLTSISLPNGVREIPDGAFYGCSALTSIILPNNLTVIDAETFRNCSSLTSIEIPSGVIEIGLYAFSGCSSLTSIEIPSSMFRIGGYAFSNCSSLTSVTIKNCNNTYIDASVFYGCNNLTSITFDGTVAEWNDITLDDLWYAESSIATVHCTDGDVTIEAL